MDNALDYGISNYIEKMKINPKYIGRVVKSEGYIFQVYTIENKIISATFNSNRLERVFVGDFVEFIKIEDHYFIIRIYPRLSTVSKASNKTAKDIDNKKEEQILVTNVDRIFILIASDQRFTISKLERYLLTFSQKSIKMDVIISKSDLSDQTESITDEIDKYYPDLSVLKISIFEDDSIEQIRDLIGDNETIVFLGSSGSGKSSLINALNRLETEEVGSTRRDGKGKHTTTYTTLIPLIGTRSYLVDTPGFKGIDSTNEIDGSILFSDILLLSKQCKFSNCKHITEKGCAVKEAIQNGELSREKYERFQINNKKMLGFKKYETLKNRKKNKKQKKHLKEKNRNDYEY